MSALLVVGIVAIFVVRGWSVGGGVEVNELREQMRSLRVETGLIAAPPQPGPPSLDATAWSMELARQAEVSVDFTPDVAQIEILRAELGANSAWSYFYGNLALGNAATADYADGVLELIDTDGAVASANAGGPSNDISAAVLETWAAVSVLSRIGAGDRIPSATGEWASQQLAACSANSFVNFHLFEIMTMLGPSLRSRNLTLLDECPISAPATGVAPLNEEELLSLVGVASVIGLQGTDAIDPSLRATLREALIPQRFMGTDSWWAHYALQGYAAVGGDPHDYASVTSQLLDSADSHGLVPATTYPSPSLQEMYFAIKIVNVTAIDPAQVFDVSAFTALEQSAESVAWADADYAMWGDALYMIGATAPQSSLQRARSGAETCAIEPATPLNARVIGMCRTAAKHLGASLPALSVDWELWRAESAFSVISSAAALGMVPDDLMPRAVEITLTGLDSAPTSVIAQLVLLDEADDALLTPTDVERIREELDQRRSEEFDQLYLRDRGTVQPDFYSTFAAISAMQR